MAEAVSQFSIGITSLNFSFVSWELSDKAIEKVASAITKFSEYLTNLMIGFERFEFQNFHQLLKIFLKVGISRIKA